MHYLVREEEDDQEERDCICRYNEPQLLADVEEHLGQTIAIVDSDFQVPVDEFDGKIVYGAKRKEGGRKFQISCTS